MGKKAVGAKNAPAKKVRHIAVLPEHLTDIALISQATPTKPVPPQLAAAIASFLSDNGFSNASESFIRELGKSHAKSDLQNAPSLLDIFEAWKRSPMSSCSSSDSSSSRSDSESDSSASDSDVDMEDAEKESSSRSSSLSASSSASSSVPSSGSDSDADDEDEDAAAPSPAPAATKPVGVKRKAESSSSSSSESDSDSDSEHDSPQAKKAKLSSKAESASSSPSEPSSDQAKKTKLSKAKSASSSESESSSSEDGDTFSADSADSDSESEKESAKNTNLKTLKQAISTPLPPSNSSKADFSSDEDDSSDDEKTGGVSVTRTHHSPSDTSATLGASPDVQRPPNKLTQKAQQSASSSASPAPGNGFAKKKHPGTRPTPLAALSEQPHNHPSNDYRSYAYADRAYQDLSVTRGKGFTKEKNKKKRGSYRGGTIDISGGKSFKFED